MKTNNNAKILKILNSKYMTDKIVLIPITHGAWASAFSYQCQDQKYIIRYSHTRENFDRDSVAHQYNSPSLPVPKILEIGESDHDFYAISKFVDGDLFELLKANQLIEFSPQLIEMFQYLRQIDLSKAKGYGHWNASGDGNSASWKEFLLDVKEDKKNSIIHNWKKNLRESSLGMKDFNKLYGQLEKYIACCPEDRNLIHSDLLNYNFIVKNNHPVAVLDWGSSIYGDSLYEIAWFLFYEKWYPSFIKTKLTNLLLEDYRRTAKNTKNISERLLAYQLHIGLDSIAYNAFKKDWTQAKRAIETTKQMLELNKK